MILCLVTSSLSHTLNVEMLFTRNQKHLLACFLFYVRCFLCCYLIWTETYFFSCPFYACEFYLKKNLKQMKCFFFYCKSFRYGETKSLIYNFFMYVAFISIIYKQKHIFFRVPFIGVNFILYYFLIQRFFITNTYSTP